MSYLSKILAKMAKAGIIKSFHGGKERGYNIGKDFEKITLYDILDLFEGWSSNKSRPHSDKDKFHCI